MSKLQAFHRLFELTEVVRFPKHHLATFGNSEIHYYLVSDISGEKGSCRLRTGRVSSVRPQILIRETLQKRFAGFGEEGEQFGRWLLERFGETLRGLEYVFQNELEEEQTLTVSSREMVERLRNQLGYEQTMRSAVIRGPDKGWQLSLLKFVIEETARSFQSNVQELEERGFFDPAQKEMSRRHREIQDLFRLVSHDRSYMDSLGQKLREYGLFSEYEDKFFSLVRSV